MSKDKDKDETVREELIRLTGLQQLPNETAAAFSGRLYRAQPDRSQVSRGVLAWLELGDYLNGK